MARSEIPGGPEGRVTLLRPPPSARLPLADDALEYCRRGITFLPDGRGILRTWGDPDAPWTVRIEPRGSRWRITSWGVGDAEARAAVRSMFSLDHPIEAFYGQVGREPVLAGTDRRFAGLRLPRDASLYESLVHAIIGQQLSVAVAATLERRLIALAGAIAHVDGVAHPYLPGPRRIRKLGTRRLRSVGLSRAKCRAITELADAAGAGQLPAAEELLRADRDSAVERLREFYGVGRWTSENALLRGAGRRDLFLAGDLGIRAALDAYGAVPRKAPEERARRWGDRHYPGWGSYATVYLWRRWITEGLPKRSAPPRRRASPGGAVGAPRRTG